MEPTLCTVSWITIETPPSRVWDALTNPRLIARYMAGTRVITDWKPGSSILYRGIWNGTPFEDRGVVVESIPPRTLVTKYWSSMSGTEDSPENYSTVTYDIAPFDLHTILTVTQDNIPTAADRARIRTNWTTTLKNIKTLLEQPGNGPVTGLDSHAPDPLVTDPDKYRRIFENDVVRVLEYSDSPGQRTKPHRHPAFVLYCLGPFSRLLTHEDGSTAELHFGTGDVMWSDAETHIGENIGDTDTRVLLIEIKRGQGG